MRGAALIAAVAELDPGVRVILMGWSDGLERPALLTRADGYLPQGIDPGGVRGGGAHRLWLRGPSMMPMRRILFFALGFLGGLTAVAVLARP